MRNLRIRMRPFLLGCGAMLFVAALAVLRHGSPPTHLDRQLAREASQHRVPLITHVVDAYELLLAPEVIAVVVALTCLALLWRRIEVQAALRGLVGVGLAAVAIPLLKRVAAAPRPPLAWQTGHETGLGFPSGHAATDVAVAIIAIVSLRLSRGWRALAIGAAVLVALGRIYANAHYGLDVLGGVVLGAGIAGIAVAIEVANPREGQPR